MRSPVLLPFSRSWSAFRFGSCPTYTYANSLLKSLSQYAEVLLTALILYFVTLDAGTSSPPSPIVAEYDAEVVEPIYLNVLSSPVVA